MTIDYCNNTYSINSFIYYLFMLKILYKVIYAYIWIDVILTPKIYFEFINLSEVKNNNLLEQTIVSVNIY